MKLNRRTFLKALGLAAVTPLIAKIPEVPEENKTKGIITIGGHVVAEITDFAWDTTEHQSPFNPGDLIAIEGDNNIYRVT